MVNKSSMPAFPLLMKNLLLTILVLGLILSASAGQQDQTANALLANVRAELPKGWTASYDEEDSILRVSRDEMVSSSSTAPNLPMNEKPERRKFSFSFRVGPGVSPAEHRRLSTENAKIQKEASAIYEDLVKKRVPHKFDSFLPDTDSERATVARYEALKKSLHDLPDYYFRDISLQWVWGSPRIPRIFVRDDKIRDECAQVRERVVKLLSIYNAT
jgi:hypothetical protein